MTQAPCIRCGLCQPVCPVDLLPDRLLSACAGTSPAAPAALLSCIECAKCNQVCPSEIDLVAQFQSAKRELRAANRAQQAAERAKERFARHALRIEQQQAEQTSRRAARLRKPRDW